ERMGGADGDKPGAPKKSAALTTEQQEILAKRGVLSPDEIHKLASKTKKAMSGTGLPPGVSPDIARKGDATPASKLSCHSDYVDPDTAKSLIEQKAGREVLVPLDVRPALGIAKEDRVV
ncbi:MAG: hypothetical protein JNK16_05655, partial [Phycisphaerales bacterium]|nr:hypothetical protein [Phycisphaerales bacterium]